MSGPPQILNVSTRFGTILEAQMRRTARPPSLAVACAALVAIAAALGADRPVRPSVDVVAPIDVADLRGGASPEISELAWIAGHWGGEAFGGQVEEGWFGPGGRSMSGSFRLIRDEVAVMYELLLLEQDDDGEIYYRFKHVGRGWEPWEETRLEYRLTELQGRKATFRSTAGAPQPNAPWWFTYESPSPDRLLVSIHGAEGGEPTLLSMTRR